MYIQAIHEDTLLECSKLQPQATQEDQSGVEEGSAKKKRKTSTRDDFEQLRIIERSLELVDEYKGDTSIEIVDVSVKLVIDKSDRLHVKHFHKRLRSLVEIDDILESQMPREEIRLLAPSNNKYGLSGGAKLSLKLGNGLVRLTLTYFLDYKLSLHNTISRKISAALIGILDTRHNPDQIENKATVTPELFYKCICEHTKELPAFDAEFDLPELETKLLSFQKKTVNWMLRKENARYNFETNRCDQIVYFSESDLLDENRLLEVVNQIWYGWRIIEISGKQVYFNKYTSHLATAEQINAYLYDYLHQVDKNQYPTTLPARCLLSEEMGLGKTVETTSLILLNQRPINEVDKTLSLPLNQFGDAKTIIKGRTTLIITPSTILQQWKNEINNLAPSLALTEYKGVSNYPMFDNKPAIIAEYLRKFDVVITTYQIIAKELDYAKYSSKLRKTRGAQRDAPYSDWKEEDESETSTNGDVKDTLSQDYSTLFQLTSLRKPQLANKKTDSSQPETDYEKALQDEIQLALRHNTISSWYRKNDYESPLMLIQFWRILLDEVQMVSSTVSKAFQSAALIPKFHAWGVSGTPIKKDINDLFSYLKFLRFYPFNYDIGVLSWQLLQKNETEFKSFWSNIAIRHTKAMVHDDIKLPPQNRILLTIPFSAVEQDLYDEKFSECLSHIGLDEFGNPIANDWNPSPSVLSLMRTWLSRLRQICCSPQVGNLQLGSRRMKRSNLRSGMALIDSLKTLDNLLSDMLVRSYGEISDFEKRKIEGLSHLTDLLEFVYHPEEAAKYLKVGIMETLDVINRTEKILDKYIQDYKSNMGSAVDDDDDDEIGQIESEQTDNKEALISSTRARLRSWLLLLHRFYFLYASANFQLYDPSFQELVKKHKPGIDVKNLEELLKQFGNQERANELASLATSIPITEFDSQDTFIELGTPQENETKYYELAEHARVKILKGVVKQFNKISKNRISNRGYLFPIETDFVDDASSLLPKSSKKFFNKIPVIDIDDLTPFAITPKVQSFLKKVTTFLNKINNNAKEFNGKFPRLVELLLEPVDKKDTEVVSKERQEESDEKEDTIDNDYEKHLEAQASIEDLLSILDALLTKRKGMISGSLEERYDPLKPKESDEEDRVDFSKLVSELTTIENELEEFSSKAVGLDIELFGVLGQKLRTLYENQKLAQTMITRELNLNCNAIFNARVEYYKQLQQISDTVSSREYPYLKRDELDSYRVNSMLRGVLSTFAELRRSMDNAIGRFRYLTELVKESQQTITNAEEDVMTCIICRSNISIGSLTQCGHKYCKECLEQWMKSSRHCPMCKARIDIHSVYNFTRYAPELKAKEVTNPELRPKNGTIINSIYKPLNQDLIQEVQEIKLGSSYSTKVDLIVKQACYLKKCDPGVQIVIFSQWQDMLYIVGSALQAMGITYVGTENVFLPNQKNSSSKKPRKEVAVEYFKKPENRVTCFLLNAQSQASGLTLVNATHIFLCEPLVNTSLELQAISRIHRIGQTKPTTVWMFAVENTVEESIIITSTNKRIRLIENSAIDESESEPTEAKLSEADSLTMMSSVGADQLLEKHAQGENVPNNDLWHSFFSAKQTKQNLGL
ncbi:hypothetical protein KGF57_001819 [Candida theae]|uniref:RING-type domain-containing protein n=1 Tax=Candida theae TaxID=1198502 RepID=A0AAD5BG45_9ASCO|nr:uncharacterized protein KGF57_001819 [Candida theae]KAI5960887.1 hypothetical protein KGF57_001819 [Candida theae]